VPDRLFSSLRRLSDADLVGRLRELAARERQATADLVAHLVELDRRGLHLKNGYGSLFVYCRDALRLAEHECYNRIEGARAARRFPLVLERLAAGELNLATLRLLAPLLTEENHARVLDEARGKRKSAVEEMVARLAPCPDAPPSVRKLPPPRATTTTSGTVLPGGSPASSAGPQPSTGPPPSAAPPASPPAWVFVPAAPSTRPAVLPLSPDRYRLQVTIAGETLEKLRLAKDMLRHAVPSGDEAALLDRALTCLLAELARKKFAATDKPRPDTTSAPGSRHIPAEVRRTVWLRDLGRCAYLAKDGRRCGERAFLEFHHLRPYAAGGEPTVENIQLRCRRHNAYEARTYFEHGEPGGMSNA
jgi:hypothetical protein